jgi:hypothetical protein
MTNAEARRAAFSRECKTSWEILTKIGRLLATGADVESPRIEHVRIAPQEVWNVWSVNGAWLARSNLRRDRWFNSRAEAERFARGWRN